MRLVALIFYGFSGMGTREVTGIWGTPYERTPNPLLLKLQEFDGAWAERFNGFFG